MKQIGNIILIILGVVFIIIGLLGAYSIYETKDYNNLGEVFFLLASGLTSLILGVIFYKKLQQQIRDDKKNPVIRGGNNKKNHLN